MTLATNIAASLGVVAHRNTLLLGLSGNGRGMGSDPTVEGSHLEESRTRGLPAMRPPVEAGAGWKRTFVFPATQQAHSVAH